MKEATTFLTPTGSLLRIAAVLILFMLPYLKLYPLVGSFPAEDIFGIEKTGDSYKSGDCIEDILWPTVKMPAPELSTTKTTSPERKRVLEHSNSIYSSSFTNKILALDSIDGNTAEFLKILRNENYFTKVALENFEKSANKYYTDCHAYYSVQHIATEYYWALKGTGVLHHWAHLYASSLSDSSGQYGYFTTYAVRSILSNLNSEGPTNFVRLAWIFYFVFGVLYILIFIYIFRTQKQIAVLALLLKIVLFTKMGGFALTIAPGFHWFRDFVLLSVPMLLLMATRISSYAPIKKVLPVALITFFGLVASYLIDPIYFSVAVLCAVMAWTIVCFPKIKNRIILNKITSTFIFIAVVVLISCVSWIQINNFLYIYEKLSNFNSSSLFDLSRSHIILLLVISSIATLLLIITPKKPYYFLHIYFAIIVYASTFYYLITPDFFHFLKFLEYSIPLGVFVIAAIINWLLEKFPKIFFQYGKLISHIEKIVFVLFAALIINNILTEPADIERVLIDDYKSPYFRTTDYIINNRLITASMSEDLVQHLKDYPDQDRIKYILSPYDKYISFLYDRNNGFGSVDFVSWLDSDQKLRDTLKRISMGAPSYVMLDGSIINVNTTASIQRSGSFISHLHIASKLNTKSRLRASELASELLKECSVIDNKGGWILLSCGYNS